MSDAPINNNIGHEETDKTTMVIVCIIAAVACVLLGIYIQPIIERNIIEQDKSTISMINNMTCPELWDYHTQLYCSVRLGCSHNDQYRFAMELYQSHCK